MKEGKLSLLVKRNSLLNQSFRLTNNELSVIVSVTDFYFSFKMNFERDRRYNLCKLLAKDNASNKRRRTEYNKLKKYLIENNILNYQITPKVISNFLMFRSIKNDQKQYLTWDTMTQVKNKVAEVLDDLGYWL